MQDSFFHCLTGESPPESQLDDHPQGHEADVHEKTVAWRSLHPNGKTSDQHHRACNKHGKVKEHRAERPISPGDVIGNMGQAAQGGKNRGTSVPHDQAAPTSIGRATFWSVRELGFRHERIVVEVENQTQDPRWEDELRG
jgi:hypothetical protein